MHHNLIVYTHPYEGSLNHAILETVIASLKKQGRDYEVIDLIKDGFNPVLTKEELRLYSRGETIDPLVNKYQDLIKKSDRIIFIYPIWWGETPALLKGFIDKVMKVHFAYHYDEMHRLIGDLSYLEEVVAITTGANPKKVFEGYGNSVQKIFLDVVWKQLGVSKNRWFYCNVVASKEEISGFLQDLSSKI
ncbi:MAG: NAD(P)H-dependent oxidoreductase [Erysipelotrichaceae bacterium]|nr:NAD(P)H-dependent oxidoreductase [Erysipelotrichaceae bacterium]